MRRTGKKSRRVFLSGAVVFLSLLLFEALLRLYADHQARVGAPSASTAPAENEIVCIGDSNTAGSGARRGRDYPAQLEEGLRRGGYPYHVVNLGQGGSNSTQAINVLEEWIGAGHRPIAALFLSGNNDGWNLREVDPRLARTAGFRWFAVVRWAQSLRTYQVLRALLLRLAMKIVPTDPAVSLAFSAEWGPLEVLIRGRGRRSGSDSLLLAAAESQLGEYSAASEDFERYLSSPDPVFAESLKPAVAPGLIMDELRRLASLEQDRHGEDLFRTPPPSTGSLDDAAVYFLGRGWWEVYESRFADSTRDFTDFLSSAKSTPHQAMALQGIGWSYLQRGDSRAASRTFDEALSKGDGIRNPQSDLIWSLLGGAIAAHRLGEQGKAEKLLASARKVSLISPLEACWLARTAIDVGASSPQGKKALSGCRFGALPPATYLKLRPSLLVSWPSRFPASVLDDNLRRLRSLADEHHFQPVVLTYPQAVDGEIDRYLRSAAFDHHLALLDLESAFALAPSQFTADDGYHPNDDGYAIIATAAADELVGMQTLRKP